MREIPFHQLAPRLREMYGQERLSHQQIANEMIAEGIAPPLGHAEWTWRSVDAVLVLSSSQRRAIEARGSDGQSESP